jgi:hypothetical protein
MSSTPVADHALLSDCHSAALDAEVPNVSAHTDRSRPGLVPSAAMSAHATWTTDIPKDDESVGGERNDDVPIEAVRWEYFTWAPTHTVWFWKVGRR